MLRSFELVISENEHNFKGTVQIPRIGSQPTVPYECSSLPFPPRMMAPLFSLAKSYERILTIGNATRMQAVQITGGDVVSVLLSRPISYIQQYML